MSFHIQRISPFSRPTVPAYLVFVLYHLFFETPRKKNEKCLAVPPIIITFAKRKQIPMSENRIQQLTKTLSALNNDERAWAMNFLMNSAAAPLSTGIKRAWACRQLSDEELQAYMVNPTPATFKEDTDDFNIQEIIEANSGIIIGGLERWL